MRNRTHENPLIGDRVTFLKTAAETNGACTLIEVQLAPGGGNALHYHTEFTETFAPVKGTLTVRSGHDYVQLAAGESRTVQPLERHAFHNKSREPIVFQVELRPGHPGFEKSIQIGYGLARDGKTNKKGIPKSFLQLGLLFDLSGTCLPGFLSLISPIFRRVAHRARKKGIHKVLEARYCT